MLPDFIIIGAMKCGTSTLAAQLAAQPGIFMSEPKEPNFFSDDPEFRRGRNHYESLFAAAAPGDLKGEASTHYTKLPTYPETVSRMAAMLAAPRLVYLIRNPLDRVVSHYIHEWTMGVIPSELDTALTDVPELVGYGCYGRQIAPFVDAFGAGSIHLASLEHLQQHPQRTLNEICAFLGYREEPRWQHEQARMNASAERIRRFPLHGLLIDNPLAQALRRNLVPQALRDRIKSARQMRVRPTISDAGLRRLGPVFAADRDVLRGFFPGHPALSVCYPFLADD